MPKVDSHPSNETVNFFISYTGSDLEYAKWIAWELGRAGFTYRFQEEHIPPGARFIHEMRFWLQNSDHVLAILTPAYFESQFGTLEFNAAIAEDPLGEKRRVIPVRVEACSMPMLFRDLVYIDFVGKSEEASRDALVAGVRAARIGKHSTQREVKERPTWPPDDRGGALKGSVIVSTIEPVQEYPVRIQFLACDVGRGLDLKGQYKTIRASINASRYSKKIEFRAEFDVTEVNLFEKLNSYRPHVVHISGNQHGGDVLLPAADGGEVVVPYEALAGLLSSLGHGVRLAIIDTCTSFKCAERVSAVVGCALGVEAEIYDDEATRFYEIFYQAVSTGLSIANAYGQSAAALQFSRVPSERIPKLCVKPGLDASRLFLVS